MKIISVINYKGGVGKTTLSANLAAELAFRGKKVLMIDLDPQASLTFSYVTVDDWKDNFEATKTIKNWYDAFIDKDTDLDLTSLIITPKKFKSLKYSGSVDLICSHLALINVDLELATRLVGGTARDLRNNFLKVHSRLKQGLTSLDPARYDYVFIDCPPNFNIVTKTAIVASDFLLVPTKPDYLSTLGIEQLITHLKELVDTYNEHVVNSNGGDWEVIKPEILGVVFTMISLWKSAPISAQQQYIAQVKRKVKAFKTMIRENKTIYADAPEYGVPVAIQKVSGVTYEGVQKELEALATELMEKLDE